MQQPRVSTAGRTLGEAPAPETIVRRRIAAPGRIGATLVSGVCLAIGLGPGTAHAAPVPAPVPEVAPADPTTTQPAVEDPDPGSTSTTTPASTTPAPPTSSSPTTAPPTSATATTAVVVADVATGAPPLVPQLASQGVVPGLAPTSLVRPTRAELPVTGGGGWALAAMAWSTVTAGAVLIRLARRRRPSVTGV